MSKPKGGKKGKKGAPPDPNRLTLVDRTFYDLQIKDAKEKILRLEAYLRDTDDHNAQMTEELNETNETRTDEVTELQLELNEHHDSVVELEKSLLEVINMRSEDGAGAALKIGDLEARYKAMHDQLTCIIKTLNAKLNSLDEFRAESQHLALLLANKNEVLQHKKHLQEQFMEDIEQRGVIEKDELKKELSTKLLKRSEEFRQSGARRTADYVQRLIRENIALERGISKFKSTQIAVQAQIAKEVENQEKMKQDCEWMNKKKRQLILNSQEAIEIVKHLATRCEDVKVKYAKIKHYRQVFKEAADHESCEHFIREDGKKKLYLLGKRIQELKRETNSFRALHEQDLMEIEFLQKFINDIKTAMENCIGLRMPYVEREEREEGESKEYFLSHDTEVSQHSIVINLIQELMEIVRNFAPQIPETPSLVTPQRSDSSMMLQKENMPPSSETSALELFRREARVADSADMLPKHYEIRTSSSIIVPGSRVDENKYIVDVEVGSTLYVSSSHENVEVVQAEEEPQEGEEAGSSSDDDSSSSDEDIIIETKSSAADVVGTNAELSIDDEDLEEEYGEGEDEEYEDEEMSINLFY